MNGKNKYPIIIGLLVPVLMVVFIVGSIYVPRFFAPPAQYDFIYSESNGYNPEFDYYVQNGRIQNRGIKVLVQDQNRYASFRLYRYYVKDNRSVGISLEEAEKLTLLDSTRSPDGFEIVPGTQGSSFLFFYSSYPDYGQMYLKGHGISQELSLAKNQPYYSYSNFHFIGWVLP